MQIITSIQELSDSLAWRRHAKSVGLVISKGNLHRGHRTLIETSQAACDMTVVTTFSGTELFAQDRALQPAEPVEQNEALLEEMGVNMLFAPPFEELYPQNFAHRTKVALPRIDCNALGGAERTHCQESVTLALKLCNIIAPTLLVLGEKHYQQLHLTERALADLNHPTRVRRVPVVRETDGLLTASDNHLLSADQRKGARLLYQTLNDIGHALLSGARHFDKLEQTARIALRGGHFQTEYVAICDDHTLMPPTPETSAFRILGAASLGAVRLADNIYAQA
ncbi:MAG: pantoate--beta-alanine ligase [Pseudomonadales bacterium]